MNILSFLVQFPYKPWNPAKADGKWSTSDLIRACRDGTILINGKRCDGKDALPGYIASVVFFPASKLRRTTYCAGIFERADSAVATAD